eukprot:m.1784 g.1784  ORF g.1784 m.1784 type:complete len:71 (-) comp2026_c1_seq1:459-671(-)
MVQTRLMPLRFLETWTVLMVAAEVTESAEMVAVSWSQVPGKPEHDQLHLAVPVPFLVVGQAVLLLDRQLH